METLILSVNDVRKIVHKVGLDRLMDETIARLMETFKQFDPHKTIIPLFRLCTFRSLRGYW